MCYYWIFITFVRIKSKVMPRVLNNILIDIKLIRV